MTAAPTTGTTTATINLPLPIGTVIPYMGPQASLAGLVSLGWKVCDGSSVSSVVYPALFKVISTTYGGDGSPNFLLPNLLGMFLRGVSPNGVCDPDYRTRTSPVSGDNSQAGPVVGSRQWFQVQNHKHQWDQNFGQITKSGSDLNVQLSTNSPNGGNRGTQDTTLTDGGGAETRPVNVYVYYLMFTGLPQSTSQTS